MNSRSPIVLLLLATAMFASVLGLTVRADQASRRKSRLGSEAAIAAHLSAVDEQKLSVRELIDFGEKIFNANWTEEDGAGRPLTNGSGEPLTAGALPLTRGRAFNRVSGPDANSCQGCHNAPHGMSGGGGDYVTNAFVMADRFDFVTFDHTDKKRVSGAVDERGRPVTLQTVGNLRSTPGLFGAGYVEMLARQMTRDLRDIRDAIKPGASAKLASKGVAFGSLSRRQDGSWDTSHVEGLPPQSLAVSKSAARPTLTIHPWRQSGSVASLRELSTAAFNQHFGMQSVERFGQGDPDGDGVTQELTRADLTAVSLFMATLPVPGRVIPNDPRLESLVQQGERFFGEIGCSRCHVASLSIDNRGWIFVEPDSDNTQSRTSSAASSGRSVDLTDSGLPQPRLAPSTADATVVDVPAFTDFKLHDISDPADPSAGEPLDMNHAANAAGFARGNRRFLTRRLWGVANEPPYFHHGRFTTMRQAVAAHHGEALAERQAFDALSTDGKNAVIEFLKSLQVLPPGTRALVVDEHYQPKAWPPAPRATQ
jgi:cytochrome c peroxidase